MTSMLLKEKTYPYTSILSEEDKILFAQEAIDLFKHRRQGHLIHRMYLSADALRYWGEFMKHRPYYVTRSEIHLISMYARAVGAAASHEDGIIGIENGPGTQSAMRKKSSVFFSAMPDLHTYIGRDWSPEIVKNIGKFMPLELFDAEVIADHANFLQQNIPTCLKKGRKVMAEFGLTQGNMEGFPYDPFPENRLKQHMAFHRSQLNIGDLYIVTFDANQDEKTITASYSSEWLTLWGRALFHTMKNELSIAGDFDPDAFIFHPIWNADSHVNINNMIAVKDMRFSINGVDISVQKGEPFGITNSYKIPVRLFADIAEEVSFEMINCFQDTEKRMTLGVFRAN